MNIQKILSNYYVTNCDNSSNFSGYFAEIFERKLLNAAQNIRDEIVNKYNIYCHFFDKEDNKTVEEYVKDIENNLHPNSNYFIIIPRFNLSVDCKEQILERVSSLSNVLNVISPLWDLSYRAVKPGMSKVIFIPDRTLFTYEIDIEALHIHTLSDSFMRFGSSPNLIDDNLMNFYQKYFASLDTQGQKSVPIKLYCNDITEYIETISEFTERFTSYCNNELTLESFNFPTLPNKNQESYLANFKDNFTEIFTYDNIRDDIADQFDSYFRSTWYYQEMSVFADLADDFSSSIISAVSALTSQNIS